MYMHPTPKIKQGISLKTYNTFAIEATADYLCDVSTIVELQQLLQYIKTHSTYKSLPLLILGGGSNILLTQDFPGIVIRVCITGINVIVETDTAVSIEIGAGENWHRLVMWSLQHHYAGIENLSLIPGLVGAAPVQNIGAYGVELADCFLQLTAVAIEDGSIHTFKQADCDFDYRHSIFKTKLRNKYIICQVCLTLSKKPDINIQYAGLADYLTEQGITSPTIHDVSNAVIAIRQQKLPDPAVLANAGSFFKNPIISIEHFHQLQQTHTDIPYYSISDVHIKLPAAWLIEQCGWRGKRSGDIGVYSQQALVLVNYGQSTGEAIRNFADEIIQSVHTQFNITLEPEVCII